MGTSAASITNGPFASSSRFLPSRLRTPNRYDARRQNAANRQIIRPTCVILKVNARHREAPFSKGPQGIIPNIPQYPDAGSECTLRFHSEDLSAVTGFSSLALPRSKQTMPVHSRRGFRINSQSSRAAVTHACAAVPSRPNCTCCSHARTMALAQLEGDGVSPLTVPAFSGNDSSCVRPAGAIVIFEDRNEAE